jgi:hypothetical protein
MEKKRLFKRFQINRQLMNQLSVVSICFSAFCAVLVGSENLLLLIAYIPLLIMSTVPLVKIHGKDIRKWWFLWRGPLLPITFKTSIPSSFDDFLRLAKVENYLEENFPKDDWKIVYDYPQSFIKFRYKRDAILFKLSYD